MSVGLREGRYAHLRSGGAAEDWLGKIPIPPRAHPLVRQLFEEMNKRKVSVRQLAAKSGVGYGTIATGWRYQTTPKVDMLEAAYNAIGLELCVREKS